MSVMHEHRGISRRRCPTCEAEVTVTWWPTKAPDGTDGEKDATTDQKPQHGWVEVVRWLPDQPTPKRVRFWLGLVLRPDVEIPKDVNRFLYSDELEHEFTLAEALAKVPEIVGESVSQIFKGLGELSGDCGTCAELIGLIGDLVGALVVMLLEPLVMPVVLLVETMAVIAALLPRGNIDSVGTGLIRHWTKDIIAHGLGPYLERWTEVISLCGAVGLANLIRQEAERQRAQRPDSDRRRHRAVPPPASRDECVAETAPDWFDSDDPVAGKREDGPRGRPTRGQQRLQRGRMDRPRIPGVRGTGGQGKADGRGRFPGAGRR